MATLDIRTPVLQPGDYLIRINLVTPPQPPGWIACGHGVTAGVMSSTRYNGGVNPNIATMWAVGLNIDWAQDPPAVLPANHSYGEVFQVNLSAAAQVVIWSNRDGWGVGNTVTATAL